jgi:hypothetical protein
MDIKITDNSPEVQAAFNDRIPLVLGAIGEIAEGYAKEDCPVDTGRLRNSITHRTEGKDEYIGTNVEYAPYVELIDRYNHTNGKAHFLRDAATTHGEEFKTTAEIILKTV